jgi:serine/threonine protein kinase
VLGKLNHPNIVRLYESIDTYSNVYLITEFLEGTPLNEYIKTQEGAKFSENESLEILQQLLDAVSYLHKKGVCHRDIKLENIVVVETSPKIKIKLIDFGFAVFFNASNPDHSLKLFCGTPSYMAPEMLAKKDYKGSNIDVWTCGVAFYALLTGYLPFAAHTERDLYKKI